MYVTLALIGFLGGLITGISPCILPVLPVIFFSGGVEGARDQGAPVSRWRPYQVILGLIVSFSLFTLLGSLLLTLLHLPQDVLRYAGIVVLVLIGIGLIVPRFEAILEKPFSWIPQKNVGTNKGGFVLGIALGAVYVPCAGPVLAAITVAGSTGKIGVETVVLTVTFALGAAIPLLIFALAGRRVAERVKSFRKHQRGIRMTGGILMMALAVGLAFNLPQLLQRLVPDYTSALQDQFSSSDQVSKALNLGGLVNDQNKNLSKCTNNASMLESCGTAPDITGIQEWFNTPGNRPIDLAQEKGKVVLVDFWAYSCINCQRSVPHVVAWNAAYKKAGLEVIGVHAPEYAFEKNVNNVKAGAQDLGITYPVAIDNNLSTWVNYRNRYWPAHYLIDAKGVVRNVQFGEGDYASTEKLIRQLLTQANPDVTLPPSTEVADSTPVSGSTTPETFLGYTKQQNFAGSEKYSPSSEKFSFPSKLAANSFALDGAFTLQAQEITSAGDNARIRLNYTAREVRMVLGGTGTLSYTANGTKHTLKVSGTPKSYRLLKTDASASGTLNLSLGAGIQAYSFTFG
ncbi:cytochrome c biogenesis protein DipZ [Leifsonia sp. Root112D2]|uniref:cytochrome c biogenesis protein DipZ n=1 Tax=Leifsonia sp. Root112D2 TaxID=1736426 RepID=UPI0006FF8C64|nr:cytochrome c biogenesis protein DipZ [Leifsonia sp. Root112D2]KQV07584.1 thiol:disulfide interchange protein [Leifsonia sp. Root112D2]